MVCVMLWVRPCVREGPGGLHLGQQPTEPCPAGQQPFRSSARYLSCRSLTCDASLIFNVICRGVPAVWPPVNPWLDPAAVPSRAMSILMSER